MKNRLTKRETEIANMVCNGLINKEIAAVLGIAYKTVLRHREHIYEKLDVHNTAELCQEILQPKAA